MAKKNNITDAGLKKLCSFLVLAASQGQLINDTLQAQDKVFSSKHVTDLINSMSEQDKKYVDDIVANLNKLSSKITNVIPDSSNAEPNTLYFYSADPNPTSYNQYMVLSDKTILNLGNTNMSLDGYLKEIDADSKYLKQVDSHTHSNKLILDSISQDKIDKLDKAVDENKVKEIIDNERPITTTINSSSTDTQVPSAKSVYDKLIVNKVTDYFVIVANNASLSKYGVDDITTLASLLSLTSKLENNSRLTIQINNAFKQTFYDHGIIPVNVSGLLVITQLYTRGQAVYITESCQTYVNATGDAKKMEWAGWKRLCATTVADVPLTNVTITDENVDMSTGYIRYRVKNGICFVSIYNVKFTQTGQQSFSCSLPKPEGVEIY